MTTKADQAVDRGADKLEEIAERTAAEDGVKAKVSTSSPAMRTSSES